MIPPLHFVSTNPLLLRAGYRSNRWIRPINWRAENCAVAARLINSSRGNIPGLDKQMLRDFPLYPVSIFSWQIVFIDWTPKKMPSSKHDVIITFVRNVSKQNGKNNSALLIAWKPERLCTKKRQHSDFQLNSRYPNHTIKKQTEMVFVFQPISSSKGWDGWGVVQASLMETNVRDGTAPERPTSLRPCSGMSQVQMERCGANGCGSNVGTHNPWGEEPMLLPSQQTWKNNSGLLLHCLVLFGLVSKGFWMCCQQSLSNMLTHFSWHSDRGLAPQPWKIQLCPANELQRWQAEEGWSNPDESLCFSPAHIVRLVCNLHLPLSPHKSFSWPSLPNKHFSSPWGIKT